MLATVALAADEPADSVKNGQRTLLNVNWGGYPGYGGGGSISASQAQAQAQAQSGRCQAVQPHKGTSLTCPARVQYSYKFPACWQAGCTALEFDQLCMHAYGQRSLFAPILQQSY